MVEWTTRKVQFAASPPAEPAVSDGPIAAPEVDCPGPWSRAWVEFQVDARINQALRDLAEGKLTNIELPIGARREDPASTRVWEAHAKLTCTVEQLAADVARLRADAEEVSSQLSEMTIKDGETRHAVLQLRSLQAEAEKRDATFNDMGRGLKELEAAQTRLVQKFQEELAGVSALQGKLKEVELGQRGLEEVVRRELQGMSAYQSEVQDIRQRLDETMAGSGEMQKRLAAHSELSAEVCAQREALVTQEALSCSLHGLHADLSKEVAEIQESLKSLKAAVSADTNAVWAAQADQRQMVDALGVQCRTLASEQKDTQQQLEELGPELLRVVARKADHADIAELRQAIEAAPLNGTSCLQSMEVEDRSDQGEALSRISEEQHAIKRQLEAIGREVGSVQATCNERLEQVLAQGHLDAPHRLQQHNVLGLNAACNDEQQQQQPQPQHALWGESLPATMQHGDVEQQVEELRQQIQGVMAEVSAGRAQAVQVGSVPTQGALAAVAETAEELSRRVDACVPWSDFAILQDKVNSAVNSHEALQSHFEEAMAKPQQASSPEEGMTWDGISQKFEDFRQEHCSGMIRQVDFARHIQAMQMDIEREVCMQSEFQQLKEKIDTEVSPLCQAQASAQASQEEVRQRLLGIEEWISQKAISPELFQQKLDTACNDLSSRVGQAHNDLMQEVQKQLAQTMTQVTEIEASVQALRQEVTASRLSQEKLYSELEELRHEVSPAIAALPDFVPQRREHKDASPQRLDELQAKLSLDMNKHAEETVMKCRAGVEAAQLEITGKLQAWHSRLQRQVEDWHQQSATGLRHEFHDLLRESSAALEEKFSSQLDAARDVQPTGLSERRLRTPSSSTAAPLESASGPRRWPVIPVSDALSHSSSSCTSTARPGNSKFAPAPNTSFRASSRLRARPSGGCGGLSRSPSAGKNASLSAAPMSARQPARTAAMSSRPHSARAAVSNASATCLLGQGKISQPQRRQSTDEEVLCMEWEAASGWRCLGSQSGCEASLQTMEGAEAASAVLAAAEALVRAETPRGSDSARSQAGHW